MMKPRIFFLSLLAVVVPAVSAATPQNDANVQKWHDTRSPALAYAYAPVFYFSEPGGGGYTQGCYATWANQPDGTQTPSAARADYPDAGKGCRTPGIAKGNQGPDFPIYFSYYKCSDNEIRIQYSIFFEKDGFENGSGHAYDWERVIVLIQRDPSTGWWTPRSVFLSQHSKYQFILWGDIQNTVNNVQAGQGDQGLRNLDHPKVYVAWAKHAIYHKRNTGFGDLLSQELPNAYRDHDWWHFSYNYVPSWPDSPIGQRYQYTWSWGEAGSNPPHVHGLMCGNLPLVNAQGL